MLARLSLLALCAVAAALALGVAAGPTGPTAAVCIGRLAEALKAVAVPQPISALAAAVEADVPFGGEQDWDELDGATRAKYFALYPNVSCENFLDQVEEAFASALASDDCSKHLEDSAEAVKMARAHPVLGPIMKAKEACFAFEPETAEQGQAI